MHGPQELLCTGNKFSEWKLVKNAGKKEAVRMALSNSQYDAIMRVYNQRQFQDKREQDKRIAEVYEKVPQVEDVYKRQIVIRH